MSRRILFLLLSTILALGLFGVTALAKDKVLMVCIEDLNASDEAVKGKLESLGYDVTIIDHASAGDENPSKYALVVISSSSTSANIAGAPDYFTTTTPTLSWESALMDDYKIAPTTFGAYDTEDVIFAIKDASHPIVAGFKGSFNPFSGPNQLHSGIVEAGKVVAMIDGMDYAGVVAVEKGEKLSDGSLSPDRRVHISSGDVCWENATADGWKLFAQAVKWLVGK